MNTHNVSLLRRKTNRFTEVQKKNLEVSFSFLVVDGVTHPGTFHLADDAVEINSRHAMPDHLTSGACGADAAELQNIKHEEGGLMRERDELARTIDQATLEFAIGVELGLRKFHRRLRIPILLAKPGRLFFHAFGARPAFITRFSPSVLRCSGAATKPASAI